MWNKDITTLVIGCTILLGVILFVLGISYIKRRELGFGIAVSSGGVLVACGILLMSTVR